MTAGAESCRRHFESKVYGVDYLLFSQLILWYLHLHGVDARILCFEVVLSQPHVICGAGSLPPINFMSRTIPSFSDELLPRGTCLCLRQSSH